MEPWEGLNRGEKDASPLSEGNSILERESEKGEGTV